jgi:hypothetical protein
LASQALEVLVEALEAVALEMMTTSGALVILEEAAEAAAEDFRSRPLR